MRKKGAVVNGPLVQQGGKGGGLPCQHHIIDRNKPHLIVKAMSHLLRAIAPQRRG